MLFDDSYRRLKRATVHGKAFRDEWESLLKPESFAISVAVSSDWKTGTAKAIPVSVPENDLALEMGEFFYQLRAALDAAIYEVSAIAEGRYPPPMKTVLNFPSARLPVNSRTTLSINPHSLKS